MISKPFFIGNATCWATIRMLRTIHQCRIPWAVANLATSLLWRIPFFANLARHPAVHSVTIDQCSYGRKWRHRTRLLFGNVDVCDLECFSKRYCSGNKVCFWSHEPHVQLTGCGANGRPMTVQAQKFPLGLCRDVARIRLSDTINRRT